MASSPKILDQKFRLMFAPEHWTPLGKLKSFLGPPFPDIPELRNAIQASVDRCHRFETLASLLNRIQPTLEEDIRELEETGFTRAARSSEFAALIETLVCELYSVLDSLRYTIYWTYREKRGVQKKSTSKLFSRAAGDEYDESFPENLRDLLAQAYKDWFLELRKLRTEFTHGGTGSCHLDIQTSKIRYMHSGLGEETRALVIDDIVEKVNVLARSVFALMHAVGQLMYEMLEGNKKLQFCGLYRGRMYTRIATPDKDLNQQSGICDAKRWFEDEPEFRCPLSNDCHAYKRAVSL